MPTENNKKNKKAVNSKISSNQTGKSDAGLANKIPAVPKARDRVKDIDVKRRGDAESNEL